MRDTPDCDFRKRSSYHGLMGPQTSASIGDRIRARQEVLRPGERQADLAARVGMSESALSRAVNGKRGLAGEELVALAKDLRVSVDWLLTGQDPFPVLLAARHRYSKENGYAHELAGEAEAAVRGIKNVYQMAYGNTGHAAAQVPANPDQARRMLAEGYGADWVRHFADAIEKVFRVDVVRLPLPESDGLSLKLGSSTVIALPQGSMWSRQNWTLAHELGHIAKGDFSHLHEGATSGGEAAANAFAAQLLMPEESMRKVSWQELTDQQLGEYLWEWGVSLKALQTRIQSLGLPPLRTETKPMALLNLAVPRKSPILSEPDRRQGLATSRRFPVRLLQDFESRSISDRALAWMLGTDVDELRPLSSAQDPSANDLMRAFGLTAAG